MEETMNTLRLKLLAARLERDEPRDVRETVAGAVIALLVTRRAATRERAA